MEVTKVVESRSIRINTKGNCDIIDITGRVASCVRDSGIKTGIAAIFVPGSTGALTTIEYEPGLVQDIREAFEIVAPRHGEYHHNIRWHDGNGFSHVRAALLGPSLTVPFNDRNLLLGTWQQIVFIDFDNRSRSRELVVQIIGE